MQIRGFLSFIYYKVIENDIYEALDKSNAHSISLDYSILRENRQPSFGNLDKKIEKFKRIFKKRFTSEQYDRMVYLLSSLKIEENYYEYEYEPVLSLGSYDSRTNTITINYYEGFDMEISQEEVLFHELMHMASTNYSFDGPKTGLNLFGVLGSKLNEGYTEYLTRKYFTRGYKYTESDENGVFLAKGIENIIGSKRMEECFFASDLKSLISDLEMYIPREDAIKLLFLIDRTSHSSFRTKDFRYIKRKIAEINQIKLDMELEQGIITQKEYEEQFAIKVSEYRKGIMWSEDTRVIGDQTSFILDDHGYTSDVYTRENEQTKPYSFKKSFILN